MQIPHTLKSRR